MGSLFEVFNYYQDSFFFVFWGKMEKDLNLKATELRLGVPGCDHKQIVSNSKNNKRALPKYEDDEATISHVAK